MPDILHFGLEARFVLNPTSRGGKVEADPRLLNRLTLFFGVSKKK